MCITWSFGIWGSSGLCEATLLKHIICAAWLLMDCSHLCGKHPFVLQPWSDDYVSINWPWGRGSEFRIWNEPQNSLLKLASKISWFRHACSSLPDCKTKHLFAYTKKPPHNNNHKQNPHITRCYLKWNSSQLYSDFLSRREKHWTENEGSFKLCPVAQLPCAREVKDAEPSNISQYLHIMYFTPGTSSRFNTVI